MEPIADYSKTQIALRLLTLHCSRDSLSDGLLAWPKPSRQLHSKKSKQNQQQTSTFHLSCTCLTAMRIPIQAFLTGTKTYRELDQPA
jgi:hypothetical protein